MKIKFTSYVDIICDSRICQLRSEKEMKKTDPHVLVYLWTGLFTFLWAVVDPFANKVLFTCLNYRQNSILQHH